MGIYLNPGCEKFQKALNSDIYVDKTEMILYLNSVVYTEQSNLSVSRPRRFGKSMAANMLCAYYSKGDSRALFAGTKLAEHEAWDQYLNQFDVIRPVMTEFMEDGDTVTDMLTYLTEEVTEELMEAYPEVNYGKRKNLRNVMGRIYAQTKQKFVIVIDEWDAIFRECKEDIEGQKQYLDFLRDWLKDKDYVPLAYMK